MYERILAQAQTLVKDMTYRPKHKNYWYDKPLTDNQRAWVGIFAGLMLGWAIFHCII